MGPTEREVAVITGGSSGLGLAMAHNLAEEGYTTVLLARNPERLDAAVGSIREGSGEALGLSCDVTRVEDLKVAADEVRERFGTVRFLVLNAGVVHVGLLTDFERVEDLKADLDTDLWGTILSARMFVPLLTEGAKVLCISSGFGLMGPAGYTAYCAAKAGVINFAAALRRELLVRRISVYVACPPDIDTPQFHQEQASMPAWMKVAGVRGRPMASEEAASKILDRCRGNRFLIVINSEIRLLILLNRLLPLRWANAVLDRMFPRPR